MRRTWHYGCQLYLNAHDRARCIMAAPWWPAVRRGIDAVDDIFQRCSPLLFDGPHRAIDDCPAWSCVSVRKECEVLDLAVYLGECLHNRLRVRRRVGFDKEHHNIHSPQQLHITVQTRMSVCDVTRLLN